MICLDFIQFIVTLSHLVHCKLLFVRIILAFEHFSINFITIFCSSSVFFKYSSISHTQDFLISRASSFWTFKFIMFLFFHLGQDAERHRTVVVLQRGNVVVAKS